MVEKISIHNDTFRRKLDLLDSWDVPNTTKKEIKDFIEKAQIGQVQTGKRLSERTLSKYMSLLKNDLEIINKETDKIEKEDIERFDKELTNKNYSSVADFRRALQVFLKWVRGADDSKHLAGWLDTRDKNKTPDYLTEQEIEKLFDYCKTPFEKYLISVLFDSGARIEELLNIRYEDIQLPNKNEEYVRLTLKEEYSKTKGRVISLYWKNSLNSVRSYLNERISEGIKSNEQVCSKTYDSIRAFLFRLGKKVLNKEVYPQLFRHSSATFYSNKLNRQELCYRYGWKFSSEMPDVYISRAGMENKELDMKFKATEIEVLKKQFELDKFNRDRQMTSIQNELKEVGDKYNSMIKLLSKLKK